MAILLSISLCIGCIGSDEEDEISSGIEDDGTGRIPSQSELIGTWQSNNYQGWEPRLEQDVVIARGLTLKSDGSYENKYRGHLTQAKDGSSLSTTEFGEWEIETGKWSYNSSNGEITYRPNSDKRVNYETMVMETCKKLLMTKKKLPVRFTGQHFTIDKVLIKDAIRQANISNQDTVLDIGAGKGFLTVHLLKIANNVVAIENDTALVEHLRKLFSDARNVQVVGCDFRNFAVPKFPFKVVSNIPYGITSDIFKILMFESLGNFLGGSIVLQLEPTQKLFSRKLYNPYTVFYHTFFDLKLVYEVGPESFFPPPTVKSALLNIKRKQLFFDFKFKAKYLAFISCLLEKPDLSVKTALKSIFRKSQVRSISEKFGLNLNAQIVCLSPSQWLNCFLEMLEVVPEKFHPS